MNEGHVFLCLLGISVYLGVAVGIASATPDKHTRGVLWFGLLWPILGPLTILWYMIGGRKPWFLK